jgi:hypothetical protein
MKPAADKIEEESDRQAMLLALAELALSRPGWDYMLRKIAARLDGEDLYDEFKRLNADRVRMAPL